MRAHSARAVQSHRRRRAGVPDDALAHRAAGPENVKQAHIHDQYNRSIKLVFHAGSLLVFVINCNANNQRRPGDLGDVFFLGRAVYTNTIHAFVRALTIHKLLCPKTPHVEIIM